MRVIIPSGEHAFVWGKDFCQMGYRKLHEMSVLRGGELERISVKVERNTRLPLIRERMRPVFNKFDSDLK